MRLPLLCLVLVACGDKTEATKPTTVSNVVPAGSGAPAKSTASACDTLVISIDSQGTWIGAPPDIQCHGVHVGGAPDRAWIEAELTHLKTELAAAKCEPGVELAADGVSYQQIVLVMDIAVKVGLIDVGLSDPDSLAMQLPGPLGGVPAMHCEGKLDTTHRPVAGKPKPTDPKPNPTGTKPDRTALQDAPVIIITTGELRLGDQKLVDLATATSGSGAIPELAKALSARPVKGLVILQADQSTDARVINRVIVTAKSAGFDNVLFAVKNK